jgi:hypothetical protein
MYMALENSPRFRLSVWRPARLVRHLDYPSTEDENNAVGVTFDSARLHEEIYQWHPGQEDVWAFINSADLVRECRELFVENFAPNRPPAQRSMVQFQLAVSRLGEALALKNASSWADTIQTANVTRSEAANLRGNCALSLWHHMEWIVRTFGSVPGASVIIR